MFVVTAVLTVASTLIAFCLPREGVVSSRAARGDWRLLLGNNAYVRFLVFSFAAYLLSQGPMWLFPIFIRSRGGDVETIRSMWVYMLVVEIPLVLASGSALQRLGARGLLGLGVFAGGLRWLLCAFVSDLQLLALVQTLHGVTVVGLLMGAPLYLDVVAPEKLRSTAQAVLSMVGVGIAGIVSNLGSGWLLDSAGIDALYAAAGVGSALLGCFVWWMLPSPARAED
jgi:MFS transporter, PPP family, 3-phenylpropionic acid transporter